MPVEYGRGVANGNVVVPIEIEEAIAFRDGAAIAFGELQSYLAARDLPATRSVQLALAGLDTRLGDAERGTAVADPDEVKALAIPATSTLGDVYPADWKAGTAEADFDVIATLLKKVSALAVAGDLRRAESSRLEAYATFELGPEQRLRGLAPSLFQRVEGLFWYGADGHDGLAQLLAPERDARTSSPRPWPRSTRRSRAPPSSDRRRPQSRAAVVTNSGDHRLPGGPRGRAHPRRADGQPRRRPSAGSGSRSWPASASRIVASAFTWVVAQTVLTSARRTTARGCEAVVSLDRDRRCCS